MENIWILAGSAVALLVVFLIEFWTRARLSQSTAGRSAGVRMSVVIAVTLGLVVLAGLAVLHSVPPPAIESKGISGATPWGMVAVMYVAMVAGIVAQSYYFGDGARLRWSWLKPALASPIIFIPLISSYQTSLSNLADIGLPELMILLVSFQNGFFWKVIFDKQAELLGQRNPK